MADPRCAWCDPAPTLRSFIYKKVHVVSGFLKSSGFRFRRPWHSRPTYGTRLVVRNTGLKTGIQCHSQKNKRLHKYSSSSFLHHSFSTELRAKICFSKSFDCVKTLVFPLDQILCLKTSGKRFLKVVWFTCLETLTFRTRWSIIKCVVTMNKIALRCLTPVVLSSVQDILSLKFG